MCGHFKNKPLNFPEDQTLLFYVVHFVFNNLTPEQFALTWSEPKKQVRAMESCLREAALLSVGLQVDAGQI